MSLAKKLYGLVGVPILFLVLIALVSISSVSSGASSAPVIVLLVVGLALAGGFAFVTVRQARPHGLA
jgi:uncharacterized membrane protein